MQIRKADLIIVKELFEKFKQETIQHRSWLIILRQKKMYDKILVDLEDIIESKAFNSENIKSLEKAIDVWIEEYHRYKIFLKIGRVYKQIAQNEEFIERLLLLKSSLGKKTESIIIK
jgi:hypothetical protein